MHKNPLWLIFLAVIGLITVWFTVGALWKVYQYSLLTETAHATITRWSVDEIASDRHAIQAEYTFSTEGYIFEGEYTFQDETYKNPWIATQKIEKYSSLDWEVSFDPEDPEYSSLQKIFPTKQCVSAAIMWGLFFYFIWLGYYVGRKNNEYSRIKE